MRLKINTEQEALLTVVREALAPDEMAYVVGGAVRDMLLGRPLHDLDLTMPDDPLRLAKRVSKRLKAGFFVLDDERHTARVICHLADGQDFSIDFVQFIGADLEADLRARDFTINAMALSARDLSTLIDPMAGQADLTQKLLRPCSDHALLDDPVRVLRGVRMALQFDLAYAPGLEVMLREAAQNLPQTSAERQRDEVFRILEGPHPANGMADCARFLCFETMIPGLNDLEKISFSDKHPMSLLAHSIETVAAYKLLHQELTGEGAAPEESLPWQATAWSQLRSYADRLRTYFSEEITPGRSKLGLALLGTWLHNLGKPQTRVIGSDGVWRHPDHERLGADLAWETAKRYQLSNAEAGWIRTLVRAHLLLQPLTRTSVPPDRKAIYRFFKQTGEVGIAAALLFLADSIAGAKPDVPPEFWEQQVMIVEAVMGGWWEGQETVVNPVLLLDGNDLQVEFGLCPGKLIGELLADLKEAQACGDVQTREEALSFITAQLNQ